MSRTLTHLDLSNCALTELPKGFCYLNDQKVVQINLEGNPLSHVENAVVKGGNPRDIIMMVKELKGGGVELKEKKVLVVGDAAVGKTTLLRSLRGEKEVEAKVATDGIEIGEFELDGVSLNCWDFAGQEVYRYTHQLFLSDSSIYLALFDLSQPIPSICSQLTYWLYSITNRAPASQILLIGTHASIVPPEKTQQTAKEVAHKFRGRVEREVLMVDSLTGEGLENVKKALLKVARRNLPRVPRLFEQIRNSFREYRDSHQDGPFIEANQLKRELRKKGALKNLTTGSWEWSLRVLNYLGGIVLVHWDSYMGNQHTRSTFVVLRPSWLVDVFKTVVTMRHNFVKDGVVSIENLRRCWQEEYDVSMHDLVFEALEMFDVVCRLKGKGDGKVIVPCLLPDCPPHDFFTWVQNGEGELPVLWGRSEENKTLSALFRRSFLLKTEKNYLPVGVIGKALSAMFQWGKVRYAWKTGCVVVCGDEDDIAVAMWEDWCGKRAGVHFVFFADKSAPSLSSSSFSSSFSCSSLTSSESPFSVSTLGESASSTVKDLLHHTSQMMQNLLDDFYKVDYEAVIPCCVDAQGVPLEWVRVKDVLLAVYKNVHKVKLMKRKEGKKGEVAIGGLAPDLMLDQGPLRFFDENSIAVGKLLGEGAYGEVWEAEVPWEESSEGPREGEEKKEEREKIRGTPKTKTVAVKKILLDKLQQKENFEEILTMLHHETYFSLQVQHPNVVKLVGMCSQSSPPLLLLELLDGVCLLLFIMIPFLTFAQKSFFFVPFHSLTSPQRTSFRR